MSLLLNCLRLFPEIQTVNEIIFRLDDNGDKYTLIMEGKLCADNVNEVQLGLESLLPEKMDCFELCAGKLLYISSAGLRLIMKLKKKYPAMEITEVQPEVYEIFKMTGFCEFMTIHKALRFVSIEGCEAIASGANGKIYRLSEDLICKVFLGFSGKADIEDEISRSRTAFVYGIPCAISFDMVRCEEGYGLVYEMLRSQTLAGCYARQPEDREALLERFAALVRRLGGTKLPAGTLPDEKTALLGMAEHFHGIASEESIAEYCDFIRRTPEGNTFLHTDLHGNNVMFVKNELNLIDMADAALGHPVFDLLTVAHAYNLLQHRVSRETYCRLQGMEPEQGAELWNGFCRHYFAGLSADTAADRRRAAEIMAYLFAIRADIPRLERGGLGEGETAFRRGEIRSFLEEILPANRDFLLGTLDNWK